MNEFNTDLPSTRHIQNLIKDKTEICIKISTGDELLGKIVWQDSNCLALIGMISQDTTLVYYNSIIYITPIPSNYKLER